METITISPVKEWLCNHLEICGNHDTVEQPMYGFIVMVVSTRSSCKEGGGFIYWAPSPTTSAKTGTPLKSEHGHHRFSYYTTLPAPTAAVNS